MIKTISGYFRRILYKLFDFSDLIKEKNKQVNFIIDDSFIDNVENGSFEIIEPLWWAINVYEGEKEYIEDLKGFSNEQKYLFAIHRYSAEVNNGGHDQFFFNSSGIVAEDALEGFRKIGLDENYNILKESMDRLGGKPFKDRDKRTIQLEESKALFDDLDDLFYKTDLEEKLRDFIIMNRNQFYFKGTFDAPSY
ncbi:DMP19 family protein [Leptospira adleri]|uniref:DMP19 family protein n=1 Tax=Leptospira adleri TaxID=2023186 RepID=UPI00108342E6|nr:DMP19 family protein [Leptospira adleri]TGM58870.1 DUF4375 domain-containing protein [Leptospira adleri]